MITTHIIRWRKSSFSGGENNECVEIGTSWRKSSYSGGESNDCVELDGTRDAIRDSKNPTGPILRAYIPGLLVAIEEGRFDS